MGRVTKDTEKEERGLEKGRETGGSKKWFEEGEEKEGSCEGRLGDLRGPTPGETESIDSATSFSTSPISSPSAPPPPGSGSDSRSSDSSRSSVGIVGSGLGGVVEDDLRSLHRYEPTVEVPVSPTTVLIP